MAKKVQPPPQLTLHELRRYEPHLTLTHVGSYECCVMVFSTPDSSVAASLPAGLELAPQGITAAGEHPVIVFIGQQRQVRGTLVPTRWCPVLRHIGLCMTYMEAAVAVPYVRKSEDCGKGQDYFCCTTLYLDELLPIYLGWLAGLPKQRGEFEVVTNSIRLRDMSGIDLFQVDFSTRGPFQSITSFPNFTPLRPMFEQDHIGQLFSLATPLLSTFVCSDFDLMLGTAQAQSIEIQGVSTPAFSSLVPTSINLPGIDGDAMGAFRLRTTWELPPPAAC